MAEEGNDQAMSSRGGDDGPSLYQQLRTITSQAPATSEEDRRSTTEQLLTVLSEKYRDSHLTREETLLRSALLVLQCKEAMDAGEQPSVDGYVDLIQTHLAHTFNSNASALNNSAFLTYASLLLTLHYAHANVKPLENELSLLAFSDKRARDIVGQWTGSDGGPMIYPDGRYDGNSLERLITHPIKEKAGTGEEFESLLGTAAIRERLREANSRVSGDAANSQLLWSLYHQFEITHLPPSPSPDDIELLQSLYFARLRTPHAAIDSTLQSYSTFVTKYLPAKDYEAEMTKAYKLVSPAKETWAACEPHETQLASQLKQQGSSGCLQWRAWKGYVSWISSAFLHSHQRRHGSRISLDLESTCASFERAIASFGLPPSSVEEMLARGNKPLSRGELAAMTSTLGRDAKAARKQRLQEELKSEQEASVDLWKRYLAFLNSAKASSAITLDVCSRASKAVSSSGPLHAQVIHTLCRLRQAKGHIDEYFSSALSNEGVARPPSSIVEMSLAWIDAQREMAAGAVLLRGGAQDLSEAIGLLVRDADSFMEIYSMMTFALTLLEERGVVDEELRLEQLMGDWCLQGGEGTAALAEAMWDKVLKTQPENTLAWQSASQYYAQRGIFKKARSLLRQVLGKREFPSEKKVVVAEDLVKLERMFGGVAEIDWALEKRESEREKSWSEYYATYAAASQEQQAHHNNDAGPEVEMAEGGGVGEKRKADEEAGRSAGADSAAASGWSDKRGREGEATKPVRDRENSSVLVDMLPINAGQDVIIGLFRGCGDIREIAGPKVLPGASASAALVEFSSRDSIPAARSRQGKVVGSNQVNISLGWQCTLYVTNFAPEFDSDERIRQLFHPHGTIFDVRWPSKKFANSRRFCYIQYCNAQSAQAALTLHEMEMTVGETGERVKMQVFLSDPNRKKVRSDAQGAERELVLSALPRGVTEEEVRSAFGAGVEAVRILKHPDGRNKGIAFVDMKTTLDAQTALGQSKEVEGGFRIKGKLITVSSADRGKAAQTSNSTLASRGGAERKNHCIRLSGLPLDAQEAIIQQVVEAQAGAGTVKRVDWTPGEAGKGTAVVELHDVAVAGRMALMASLMYDEAHRLQVGMLESRGAAAPMSSTNAPSAGPSSFAPRQAIRGRGGRGARGGLGSVRRAPVFASPSNSAGAASTEMDLDKAEVGGGSGQAKTQDAFREMLKRGK